MLAATRHPRARGTWVVAGLVVVLLMTVAGRYGFHPDELYFVVTGRHAQAGATDNGMLVPYLAAGWYAVVGGHLWAFRLLPALAAGAYAALGGLSARELGATPPQQVVAAALVGSTPYALALGHLFETTTADMVLTGFALLMLLRALHPENDRWGPWVAAGVLVGLALETKVLAAVVLSCCLVGVLLVGPRRPLATPRPWVAAAVALAVGAPNLLWQATHGLPMLGVAASIAAGGSTSSTPRALLVPTILLEVGPPVAVVLLVGVVVLLRRPLRSRHGWLAAGFVLFVVVMLLTGGKAYYPAAFAPALIAAGVVPVVGWVQRGRRWRTVLVAGLGVVSLVVTMLIALPLGRPGSGVYRFATGPNPDLASEVGLPGYVATVGRVTSGLGAPDAVVVARYYSLAAPLQLLGPAQGVRLPVYSGHNAYWAWGPPPAGTRDVVVVGDWTDAEVASLFGTCRLAATVTTPPGVDNDLTGLPVRTCSGPPGPWTDLWPRLRTVG